MLQPAAPATPTENHPPDRAVFVDALADRAKALYLGKTHLCSEAVLAAVSEAFASDVDPETAAALGKGLGHGMGDGVCVCGVVSGACAALGMILGKGRGRREILSLSNRLATEFKTLKGSTCCRALCKAVKHDKRAHFLQCAELTELGARLVARALLDSAPELAKGLDLPAERGGALRRAFRRFLKRRRKKR